MPDSFGRVVHSCLRNSCSNLIAGNDRVVCRVTKIFLQNCEYCYGVAGVYTAVSDYLFMFVQKTAMSFYADVRVTPSLSLTLALTLPNSG